MAPLLAICFSVCVTLYLLHIEYQNTPHNLKGLFHGFCKVLYK